MVVGFPESSSSPVRITVIEASSNACAACKAFNAYRITTSPPLSSRAPGPVAILPWRAKCWNGLSIGKTVSRWPIKRSLFPLCPGCSAIHVPARFMLAGSSTQRTLKPSASNCGRNSSPIW